MKYLKPAVIVFCAFFLWSCEPAYEAEQDPKTIDAQNPPGMIETSFMSHGARLNALLYTANGAGPHPTLLLLHGYPGNEKNLDLAQYLRRAGWNVFFFHYRGAWGSEGEFSFLNAAEDVAAALEFLRTSDESYRVDKKHIAIVGHSMGGKMTLAAGSLEPNIACLVTLAAAPVATPAEYYDMPEAIALNKAYADGLIMLKGHDGTNLIEQQQAFDVRFPLEQVATGLEGKHVFLIGAEQDTAVPISVFHTYVEAFSKHPDIALTSQIYDTDHSFSTHRVTLGRTISAWLNNNCVKDN